VTEPPTFLTEPPASVATEAVYAADRESDGYVWNVTRLWGWRPDLYETFAALRAGLMESSELTARDFAVLVTATAAQRYDSYCSFAWGERLAKLTDDETAALVLTGEPAPELSERETALAGWARRVVADPNATTALEVARLREVGLSDREIFEATAFVGFRLAFSTVNDALGAAPDKQLADAVPERVRAAVTYGRAASPEPSPP
jgi:alkylhydroperoxidase family enzyme